MGSLDPKKDLGRKLGRLLTSEGATISVVAAVIVGGAVTLSYFQNKPEPIEQRTGLDWDGQDPVDDGEGGDAGTGGGAASSLGLAKPIKGFGPAQERQADAASAQAEEKEEGRRRTRTRRERRAPPPSPPGGRRKRGSRAMSGGSASPDGSGGSRSGGSMSTGRSRDSDDKGPRGAMSPADAKPPRKGLLGRVDSRIRSAVNAVREKGAEVFARFRGGPETGNPGMAGGTQGNTYGSDPEAASTGGSGGPSGGAPADPAAGGGGGKTATGIGGSTGGSGGSGMPMMPMSSGSGSDKDKDKDEGKEDEQNGQIEELQDRVDQLETERRRREERRRQREEERADVQQCVTTARGGSGRTAAQTRCASLKCGNDQMQVIVKHVNDIQKAADNLVGERLATVAKEVAEDLKAQDKVLDASAPLLDDRCPHTDCEGEEREFCESTRGCVRTGRDQVKAVKRKLGDEKADVSGAQKSQSPAKLEEFEKRGLAAIAAERAAVDLLREHMLTYQHRDQCVAPIPEQVDKNELDKGCIQVAFDRGQEVKGDFYEFTDKAWKLEDVALASIEDPWCERHPCELPTDKIEEARELLKKQTEAYNEFLSHISEIARKQSEADKLLSEAGAFLASPRTEDSRYLVKGYVKITQAKTSVDELDKLWKAKVNEACTGSPD